MDHAGVASYDGVSSADLAIRLRVPTCVVRSRVSSTLDVVHELAAAGAPAGTLVVADQQVAGRGRMGRRWHSPARQGVWLGYLLRDAAPARAQLISVRVGLAVVRALGTLGAVTSLKWPNDIVWEGRKLGGILCEARWQGVRIRWIGVGIGINVHGPLPPELLDRAATLDELLDTVDRLGVLEVVLPALQGLPDAPGLSDDERAQFAACDWLKGRVLRAPVAGTAQGVAADGALLVETGAGTERVVGGSIVTV